jgi:hypothetical protein
VAQRRKSNKRTKKNKEEQNDLKGKQWIHEKSW